MQIYTRYVNIIVDRGRCGDWIFKILVGYRNPPFNKGAGYIGGATLYLGWKCVARNNMYRATRKLRAGITRNANNVPWTRH